MNLNNQSNKAQHKCHRGDTVLATEFIDQHLYIVCPLKDREIQL